ncbi:Glutamate-1-semialdehyde 2,1-aminomutase [Ephemeroptericola cinctiostellae]|uniref:Glutamate-1-semialdehyde 2,1-aminomutase n=1 Tax=Ephemeroptericola cinctiostellae TaxID=2268024 RepID=A0A345DCA8_9BURK|nr:transaminase [Ephemeroptericola cinctiostellae]AXF85996.1 Glutamate-1-semialdehyde 2,1-aminomutase [Ephemeroptericola cinctiostellae]
MELNTQHIKDLYAIEQTRFEQTHQKSKAKWEAGRKNFLYGGPSHWMRRWVGGWPAYISKDSDNGYGVKLTDIDGNTYVDFCLGDSGGMYGHGHPKVVEAMVRQASIASTMMLPNEDAEWVGAELERRFGLPYWTFTTSATDANRACIRLARMVTGRKKVLVFSGCYHGTVEEAHVELNENGDVQMRNGIYHNDFPHAELSAVVEFNDIPALEAALRTGDVACVLAEPMMTNFGMIEPITGFHDALRQLTRETGTLLIIDETHTFSNGYGGYTAEHGLEPDFFVVGKSIAGGIPAAVFGATQSVAERIWQALPKVPPTVRQSAHAGFGGTLAGNALTVSVMKTVLSEVLTKENFAQMVALASELAQGVKDTIAAHGLPWHVMQVGARVEILFSPDAPRNAPDVRAGRNGDLDTLLHLYLLNRGVLITPFHNMMLMSPGTTSEDVKKHHTAFAQFAAEVTAK